MTGYVLTVGVPAVTTNTTALLLLALALTLTPATHRAMGRGSRGQRHTAVRAGPTCTRFFMRAPRTRQLAPKPQQENPHDHRSPTGTAGPPV